MYRLTFECFNSVPNNISLIDLCVALSDIFIDNEIDYNHIATIAKKYPIGFVEYIFFEWVTPVCYSNICHPVPMVWAGFNRDQLWKDLLAFRSRPRKNRFISKLEKHYLRKKVESDWLILKELL